ncbi:helix-turn-helix domain-containing protein [Brevundimonas sp.]|uniref:AraC family transcriptional regulator n=1 Tax=Brevundimonas sp. TaxID=1871086 RepID=UPI003AFFCDAC
MRASEMPAQYDPDGPEGRIASVILDELATAPIENFRLPIPSDPRLRALAEAMIANPAASSTVAQWAAGVGMSERTLNRRLSSEIGMGFGRWRRQIHILLALRWLASGRSVPVGRPRPGLRKHQQFRQHVSQGRRPTAWSLPRQIDHQLRLATYRMAISSRLRQRNGLSPSRHSSIAWGGIESWTDDDQRKPPHAKHYCEAHRLLYREIGAEGGFLGP